MVYILTRTKARGESVRSVFTDSRAISTSLDNVKKCIKDRKESLGLV
jgi:hypothetical protein